MSSDRVTVHQQKKTNSVIQQSNDISKPSSPTEKAVQTLTCTRFNPNFCVCGSRHAILACPAMNPVQHTIPAPSSHNPEAINLQNISKPSKCNACVILEKEEHIDDEGVEVTTMKTKLCPVHLEKKKKSTPISSSSSTSSSDPSPNPSQLQDDPPLSLPKQNDILLPSDAFILDLLLDDPDPFQLLTEDLLKAGSSTDNTSSKEPAKKKRRQRCAGSFETETTIYHEVRERVTSGEHLVAACKKSGVKKSSFYERRYIVELMETDPDAFSLLYSSEKRLKVLNKMCMETLKASPLKRIHESLKQEGKLLPF